MTKHGALCPMGTAWLAWVRIFKGVPDGCPRSGQLDAMNDTGPFALACESVHAP